MDGNFAGSSKERDGKGEILMGCTYFSGPGFVGHICHGDHWLSLEPYGAKVWCDDHNYLGPTFYRSESAIKVIDNPSRKTWKAYSKWREMAKEMK